MNIKRDPSTGDRLEYRRKKTAKTNGVMISIPTHPDLADVLAKLPNDRPFLATADGKGRSPDGLGNSMREWCDKAGLPECSAHSLRKAIARRLAEAWGDRPRDYGGDRLQNLGRSRAIHRNRFV